jgi:hypothetical protein
MSAPSHHNDVVLQGEVQNFFRGPLGTILGILLAVDAGEAALVPVVWRGPSRRLSRGDLVAVRGTLASEKWPGVPYPLVYLWPTHVEVLTRRKPCPSRAQPAPPA